MFISNLNCCAGFYAISHHNAVYYNTVIEHCHGENLLRSFHERIAGLLLANVNHPGSASSSVSYGYLDWELHHHHCAEDIFRNWYCSLEFCVLLIMLINLIFWFN